MDKNLQGYWDNPQPLPKIPHHYGCRMFKKGKGNYSLGIGFNIYGRIGEFCLYINIVKCTLCIGRFAELDNVEEDE